MGFLVGPTAMVVYQVAGVAAMAVGAGMQYSAAKQAASDQAAMAKYNYAIQAQNIRQQQAMAQWSAGMQARQAEGNAAIARQTAETNARNLENQAQGQLLRGVEEQRRTREDQLRLAAMQRARVAKSGVAGGVGSPVEVLAESARYMQLALNDAWYETNTKRDSLLWDAKMQRYGGDVASAQYGMDAAMARAEGALAPIRARMDLRKAGYERLAGLNQAANMKSMAKAQLVSDSMSVLASGLSAYGTASKAAGAAKMPKYTVLKGTGHAVGDRPPGL
jgi:hypothetical protein